MPGIPSTQRCQSCKARKVKCDEAWPVCTPCKLSRRVCSGPPMGAKFVPFVPPTSGGRATSASRTSRPVASSSPQADSSDENLGVTATGRGSRSFGGGAFQHRGTARGLAKVKPGTLIQRYPTHDKRQQAGCREAGSVRTPGSVGDASQEDVLKRLQRTRKIPSTPHSLTKDFTTSVVHAAYLYNTTIAPLHSLGDLWVDPITFNISQLSAFAEPLHHALVCFAMGVTVFRRADTERSSHVLASKRWEDLHMHRALAVRALNARLDDERTRLDASTFTCISLLLSVECNSNNWLQHYRGLLAFMRALGGIEQVEKDQLPMLAAAPSLLAMGHAANTTSPPLCQVNCLAGAKNLDLLVRLYKLDVYTPFPCPTPLFIELVHINKLRVAQAMELKCSQRPERSVSSDDPAASPAAATSDKESRLMEQAHEVILRIMEFDPEDWAVEERPLKTLGWSRIARCFQAAVANFAATSLFTSRDTAVSFRDATGKTRKMPIRSLLKQESQILVTAAKEALAGAAPVHPYLCWPMLVLGVTCNDEDLAAQRDLVRDILADLSLSHGEALPLLAIEVLEKYWTSGTSHWNDCFDKQYAFLA